MKIRFLALFLAACATTTAPQGQPQQQDVANQGPKPPVAKREPHLQTLFGQSLIDDYWWLRQKGTAAVEQYLQAENAYTDVMMKPTEGFQKSLYDEMLARIEETDVTVPRRKNGYYYYQRTEQGKQYPILCRKSGAGAAKNDLVGETAKASEEVMIDLNELAKTQKFVGLGAHQVSEDSRWMAFAIDATGFRQFTLRFKDLTTGALTAESIERVDDVAWASDSKHVFYVVEDPVAKRAYRLYRHLVGSDTAQDKLVYEEKDEMFELSLERARSGGYLIATSESKTTTEVRVLDAKKPEGNWVVIEPRQHDHKYFVTHQGSEFLILTNSPDWPGGKKAVNFRLVSVPVATPQRNRWKEIIGHRDDVTLEGVEAFSDHLVLLERTDALPRLTIVFKDGSGEEIEMPEPIFAVFPDENPEYVSGSYRFHFQSPITPDTVYDYEIKSKSLKGLKRQVVKGDFEQLELEEKRIKATAPDGTKIPISLVFKKGLKQQPHPMLLYGYGSYGITIPLNFSSDRVSLLDRGVVYALAHIRGGGDMGKPWHEGARMATKMNTFTDFIACGQELIKTGWTAHDRLVIQGGSAGGLLMGAVANLRPDLWKGVVAQVPFVDVINTMLDETLPLTVGEFEEWGNPKKKDEFDWMARYSPYDNVGRKDYPSMLIESSYNDSQVMYWEPAKYVAKLRALKTDKNPLLFKVHMDPAGHHGKSGRYDQLHETAFTYAWILTQLGINK